MNFKSRRKRKQKFVMKHKNGPFCIKAKTLLRFQPHSIRNSGGLVDRIPDCHAGSPGSIPWLSRTLFGELIRQSLLCHTDLDPKNSQTTNSSILEFAILHFRPKIIGKISNLNFEIVFHYVVLKAFYHTTLVQIESQSTMLDLM